MDRDESRTSTACLCARKNHQIYPPGEATTPVFDERRTVILRLASSGTDPSPTRLTVDGDLSDATLGVRAESASADSLTMLADADVAAGSAELERMRVGRTPRMSLLDCERRMARVGAGLPGMPPRRGGADWVDWARLVAVLDRTFGGAAVLRAVAGTLAPRPSVDCPPPLATLGGALPG